jgi:hypothetical protein
MALKVLSRFFQPWLLLGLLLTAPLPARAQLTEVELAEELVRAHYAEGLPYEEARELTPDGVDRLVEMLQDPAEAEHHDNVVMALGISGDPQAFLALSEFHESAPEGEVDRAEFRARRAIPHAMGHLAQNDERAYQFLVRSAHRGASSPAPGWTYHHLSGKKLKGFLRRAAITGVAKSGRPGAVAELRKLEARTRADPKATDELRTHIRESQELGDVVTREGPDRVFGGDFSR